MKLFRDKKTRAVFLTMVALVFISVLIATIYYKKKNNAVDPRIRNARILYEKYNSYVQQNDFDSVFFLMDTIESIYASFEHYKDAYEVGVLYNNRAAALLTQALAESHHTENKAYVDSLIEHSRINIDKSIEIYQNWLARFSNPECEDISKCIYDEFFTDFDQTRHDQADVYLKNRVIEISESIVETERRLSVSYTNLGIVYRHQEQYEQAAICYKKAVDLWDQNLTAENNLNRLLGRPEKKRSMLRQLFPPQK